MTNNRSTPLSPELELLLCCARMHPDAETTARAGTLIRQKPDWDRLLKLALHQRVMPLVYRQLSTNFANVVPEIFIERLRDYFFLNAARNHSLADEVCELLRLLEQAGIGAIPYKGPALALRLYGDIALRQFSDLDILVRRSDVASASQLLESRGYKRPHSLTPRQESAFLKIDCEYTFARDEGPIHLDLHWDLVPWFFSLQIDMKGIWNRLERMPMCDTEVSSFSPEDLLVVLSVHASKDYWQRLVWICDIAEAIKGPSNLDWPMVLTRASSMGARRMLFVSLVLARDLFDAPVPAEIEAMMKLDRELGSLVAEIKSGLLGEETIKRGVSDFLKPARALERRRDRARFYLRLAMTPTVEDWMFVSLPRGLYFLYYLSRPVRLVKKYVRSDH